MGYLSNYKFSEIGGVNATPLTETQLVVDLSYKAAGARGVLLSEAPLKEFPTTPITLIIGGTTYTEVDITAGYPSGTNFCVEYSSNSGVIYLPTAVALGTSCTVTYKATGTVASIESKQYNLDGTVGAPGISFANDPDTGRYRIGANTVGESVGGVKVAEINSLGLINGTAGTEFRNVLQIVEGQATMTYSVLWTQTANTNYWLVHQGTYTPKSSSSKLIVTGNATNLPGNNNQYYYVSYATTSYGTVRTTNQAGAPTTLVDTILGGTVGQFVNAPICSVITGLVAGTQYFIALWSRVTPAFAVQHNRDNTRSQIIFTEVL